MADFDVGSYLNTVMAENNKYNQQVWARDDNAIQRRVADLKAAGLNPVLAANGYGAGNSAGSSPINAFNSASQRLNTELDYKASMESVVAQLASANASLQNALATNERVSLGYAELQAQQDYNRNYFEMQNNYNDKYLDILGKYYDSLGGKASAETGKIKQDTEIGKYNYDFFKDFHLPTVTGINLKDLPLTNAALDPVTAGTFIVSKAQDVSDSGTGSKLKEGGVLSTIKNVLDNRGKRLENIGKWLIGK